MNASDPDSLWQSPLNQPDPNDMNLQKEVLLRHLRSRYRCFFLITGIAGLWLILISLRLAYRLAHGLNMDMAKEWGVLLAGALPVAALAIFWTQHYRHRRRHPAATLTLRASLQALLDENRLAHIRLRLIALLHGLLLILLPLVTWQLRSAGKAGDEILFPFLVLFPLLQVVILGAMYHHYRHRLQPRRAELEKLMAQMPA